VPELAHSSRVGAKGGRRVRCQPRIKDNRGRVRVRVPRKVYLSASIQEAIADTIAAVPGARRYSISWLIADAVAETLAVADHSRADDYAPVVKKGRKGNGRRS